MLAKTQIGVEEYFALELPDRAEPDYVHGEVVERAMPSPVRASLVLMDAGLLRRASLQLPEFDFTLSAEDVLKGI